MNWKPMTPALAGAVLLAYISGAQANPVDVTYTVSGSPGDWILNFSVTDNLGGTNDLYFFGVSIGSPDIVGSPTGWSVRSGTWSNAGYGGSSTTYDNTWIAGCCSPYVLPGGTLSGFEVLDTSSVAPASVQWFAWANLGTYNALNLRQGRIAA
jgi:hypothetical protein